MEEISKRLEKNHKDNKELLKEILRRFEKKPMHRSDEKIEEVINNNKYN